MSVLSLILVAFGGGLATMLLTPLRPRVAAIVGVATAVAATYVALAMSTDDSVVLGGTALAASDLVRLVAIGWAAGTVVLGLLEIEIGRHIVVTGPAMIGLAAAVIALAAHDPATGFAALASGGVGSVAVPSLLGWSAGRVDPGRVRMAMRGSWAVLGSGLVGIVVVGWAASPVGPLGGGTPSGATDARAAASLALLGIVAAVVIRAGLIPTHVWAARFIEGVSPLAVPTALLWGSAAFMLVALEWAQVAIGPATVGGYERALVVLVAISSIVLGGLAATLHDDIEHVLGYSILQDAGVAVLAFASLHGEAADAARDWLLASAALKTAFAAWIAAMRSTFGAHRLADLRGWMRKAPWLAVGFGIIAVGAIGLPGMALFDARAILVNDAVGGPAGVFILVAALTPIAYLGRILATGIGRPTDAVASAPSGNPRWRGGREAGWSDLPLRQILRALPAELEANRAPLVAVGVVILAAIGFAFAAGGVTD
jgi:NADH-quinone oxidoreductase subunit N